VFIPGGKGKGGLTNGTQRGRRVILLGLLALAWLFGGGAHPAGPELGPLLDAMGILPPVKETEAPDFTLPDLAGTPRRLADFRGQVVLINFWATWCLPCRAEMPAMERIYQEMKNDGFTILAVNFAETAAQVEPFVKELRLTFPILLDQESQVVRQYRAFSLPTTYVLDRHGTVVGRAIGAREWDSADAKRLVRALRAR